MTGPVLAVDQGTSGTEALVVCPERGVIGSGAAPVRPRRGAGGPVGTDPADLLASVLAAGRRALGAAGEPDAAVGLADQGGTVLARDPETGRPLTGAIVWQDRRSAPARDELDPYGEELKHLTGLPPGPCFAAPEMAWIRREPTREDVVTTSDSWLVHQLTGAFVTDTATAGRTQPLDLERADWSPRALDVLGLGGERLPAVVDSDTAVGTTTAVGPEPPLTGLLVDQQDALPAQNALDPGDAKCTYGTGAFLDHPVRHTREPRRAARAARRTKNPGARSPDRPQRPPRRTATRMLRSARRAVGVTPP